MIRRWFSLIEMLIVVVIVSLVFTIVLAFYFDIMRIRVEVEARQALLKNSYTIFEKLNILIKDYTIDYEEYFNRSIVWCDGVWGAWFTWNVGDNWICDRFTHFWNSSLVNPWDGITDRSKYFCSSQVQENSPNLVYNGWTDVTNWLWCWSEAWNWLIQPYWSYGRQFWDMRDDVDSESWLVGDDDDEDLWNWPDAINDNESVQELYLISKNKRDRILIRRNKTLEGDWDKDWTTWNSDIDRLYSLQMIKLKWFDAWNDHSFDDWTNVWMFDWDIDTWTCNAWEGYMCNWTINIWWWYNDYKISNSIDDWWVNMFWHDVTISEWDMKIYPTKDGNLSYNDNSVQINPYVEIHIQTRLYWEPWSWRVSTDILEEYSLDLQTTFNMKLNY